MEAMQCGLARDFGTTFKSHSYLLYQQPTFWPHWVKACHCGNAPLGSSELRAKVQAPFQEAAASVQYGNTLAKRWGTFILCKHGLRCLVLRSGSGIALQWLASLTLSWLWCLHALGTAEGRYLLSSIRNLLTLLWVYHYFTSVEFER